MSITTYILKISTWLIKTPEVKTQIKKQVTFLLIDRFNVDQDR